jgi:hypothetical protein
MPLSWIRTHDLSVQANKAFASGRAVTRTGTYFCQTQTSTNYIHTI